MHDRLVVSLEGLPGAGKTTSARLVAGLLGAGYNKEKSDDVPFLADFYSDVERYKFETEICFLLVHYHQYRDLKAPVVLDFSPVKDLIFADMNLSGEDYRLFRSLYDRTSGSCKQPDLAVFLDLPVDQLLYRIERRGRAYEKGLNSDYLEALRVAYGRRLDELGSNVVTVSVGPLDSPEEVALAVRDEVTSLEAVWQ